MSSSYSGQTNDVNMKRIEERIASFVSPTGFERVTVRPEHAFRSAIYTYGVKCCDVRTKRMQWFCMCDDDCALAAMKGFGLAMSGNSSTSALFHLRERHMIDVQGACVRRQTGGVTAPLLDETRIALMQRFVPPQGFTIERSLRSHSIMYTYGVMCLHSETRRFLWFCFCNDTCAERSLKGTAGISLNGRSSTNSLCHLNKIHNISPTLRVGRKRKCNIANDHAASVTPVNVAATPSKFSRISPFTVMEMAPSSEAGSAEKEDQNARFVCPPGYVISTQIRPPGSKRSFVFEYGVPCIHTETGNTRWFCCASEKCRKEGTGISMNGRVTTNCSLHLRSVHNIISNRAKLAKSPLKVAPPVQIDHTPLRSPAATMLEGVSFFQSPRSFSMIYSSETFAGSPTPSNDNFNSSCNCIRKCTSSINSSSENHFSPIAVLPVATPITLSFS